MSIILGNNAFLRGALILAVAGVAVKMIGSVNRILLSRLLGGEGIGLYQMAYPIYLLALSVSSAGIPVAISILVAERIALSDYRGAARVFRVSLVLLVATGIVFAAGLFFGADWLISRHIVRDARAYYAIIALAPAVFFATILASYRGYFQGQQLMTPTAASQVAEQLVRVVTMVVLAYWLLPRGLEYAAAGASFGAGPGAFSGLCVLLFFHWRHRRRLQDMAAAQPTTVEQQSVRRIAVRLAKLALPVSMANIMAPAVSSIDMLLVPARLELAGFSVERATALFGYLTGMAMPLVMMATIPTASLAASLVPAVSEANALRDADGIKHRVRTALRLCYLITIPSFVGLWVLATPISRMLYGTEEAGQCIAILALAILLLGVHQVTTGALQGLGHTAIPVVNMVFSAAVKIGLVWTLTAMPEYNIAGAAWATNIDFALAALLNIYFVWRYTGFAFSLSDTAKAAGSAVCMGLAVHFLRGMLTAHGAPASLATLAAVGAGLVVYSAVLVAVGGVGGEEIAKIPVVGKKAAYWLRKLHVVRDEND